MVIIKQPSTKLVTIFGNLKVESLNAMHTHTHTRICVFSPYSVRMSYNQVKTLQIWELHIDFAVRFCVCQSSNGCGFFQYLFGNDLDIRFELVLNSKSSYRIFSIDLD